MSTISRLSLAYLHNRRVAKAIGSQIVLGRGNEALVDLNRQNAGEVARHHTRVVAVAAVHFQ